MGGSERQKDRQARDGREKQLERDREREILYG